ncbi:glutamate-gated chloride channel alpha-like [Diabrotica undecimpunctata]|uniref:glutamate-gated chloride channel alpha-like n=1 Tax=Diabrotica undecimpunctata TaxID=50387 RepID=UPI003B639A5C
MGNRTYLDCLMLLGATMSLDLPDMNSLIIEDVYTTTVTLSVTVEDISIDDKNLDMQVIFLLNQKWQDPRLGANIQTRNMAVAGKIWDPKITNCNGNAFRDDFKDTLFWRGYEEGSVIFNRKMKLRLKCTRYLQKFPFDVQFCEIKFGSYRFPKEEVSLKWDNQIPIIMQNKLKSTEFYLQNVSTEIITEIRPTGNFSAATVWFTIKRDPNHYLISIGAICSTLTILSYLSMWTTGSNRTQLNLISFIVHIYFYYYSTSAIYPVPYLKRLDILVGLSSGFSLILFISSIMSMELRNTKRNNVFSASLKLESDLNTKWKFLLMRLGFPLFYITVILMNLIFV